MEITELERVVEAILFAAGESVPVERMVIATGCGVEQIHQAARTPSILPKPWRPASRRSSRRPSWRR